MAKLCYSPYKVTTGPKRTWLSSRKWPNRTRGRAALHDDATASRGEAEYSPEMLQEVGKGWREKVLWPNILRAKSCLCRRALGPVPSFHYGVGEEQVAEGCLESCKWGSKMMNTCIWIRILPFIRYNFKKDMLKSSKGYFCSNCKMEILLPTLYGCWKNWMKECWRVWTRLADIHHGLS